MFAQRLIGILLLFTLGCTSVSRLDESAPPPTGESPPPFDLNGAWSGLLTTGSCSDTIATQLTQSATSVSGAFSTTCWEGGSVQLAGQLSGDGDTKRIEITLTKDGKIEARLQGTATAVDVDTAGSHSTTLRLTR